MCSEINEVSKTSDEQEKTLKKKVDALRKSLINDKIIYTDKNGDETVTNGREHSVMVSTLIEFILNDRDGPKILRRIVREYPDLRAHFIQAFEDLNCEMSPETKNAISWGSLSE